MLPLTYLKLGGSLITDKSIPFKPRLDVIEEMISQISRVLKERPGFRLILGHGSGSFGHMAAKSIFHNNILINKSVPESELTEIWYRVTELNRIVISTLHHFGIPAISFSPNSSILVDKGKIISWNLESLIMSIEKSILPVIYGDMVFDKSFGFSILSTEQLFSHLSFHIPPNRILLVGKEQGIWQDFPKKTTFVKEITPATFTDTLSFLGKSQSDDVTGGMLSKVSGMIEILNKNPDLEINVFSGTDPSSIYRALNGESLGTHIHS